jgi:type IV pilus assembly protein PilM
MPLFNKTKNFLGIDVGTFSIKVVELSYSKKGKVVLENYGEIVNDPKIEDVFYNPRKKSFSLSHQIIANNIKKVLDETGIKKREAFFSIPDFMTFFTVFKTPPMPQEEIGTTIKFEARQHIPLPLKDVTLDWSIIEKSDGSIGPKILLVAVPNKVIEEYQEIAQLAGVSLLSIEAEVFSLARTIFAKEEPSKTIQLVDVGVQSTTISIINNSMVKATHSVDFSEMDLVKELAVKMNLSYNEASEIKRTSGFNENSEQGKILSKKLDSLVNEINQIADNLFRTEKKEVNKIIVSGGTSLNPGFKDYIQLKTKKETQIINPFLGFSYAPALEKTLAEMGPRYAIATGLALRDR